MKNQPLFSVENRHIESCGVPASIVNPERYAGYYENEYCEQFIFEVGADAAWIYAGELGWQNPVRLELEWTWERVRLTVALKYTLGTYEWDWLLLMWQSSQFIRRRLIASL